MGQVVISLLCSQESSLAIVKKKKWLWFGQLSRHTGGRRRGRQRKSMTLEMDGPFLPETKSTAADRQEW